MSQNQSHHLQNLDCYNQNHLILIENLLLLLVLTFLTFISYTLLILLVLVLPIPFIFTFPSFIPFKHDIQLIHLVLDLPSPNHLLYPHVINMYLKFVLRTF